jgi:hypothetical protein
VKGHPLGHRARLDPDRAHTRPVQLQLIEADVQQLKNSPRHVVPALDRSAGSLVRPQEAEAARQRADVEARAADALAAREQRLAEFDAAAVGAIGERMEALRAQEAEAREQLRAAVLADPVNVAYTRLLAARDARRHLDGELSGIAVRLGRPEHRPAESYSTPSLAEMVTTIVEQEARAHAADVIDEHEAAREAAGAGPEGTPSDYHPDVEVTLTTAADGRQVKITRNIRTGARSAVDVETGRPYSPPPPGRAIDDGTTDA